MKDPFLCHPELRPGIHFVYLPAGKAGILRLTPQNDIATLKFVFAIYHILNTHSFSSAQAKYFVYLQKILYAINMIFSRKKLIGILIVVTFLTHLSSLNNPFIWDDEQFIQKNLYVQNFDIQKIFTTNTVAGAGVQSNYYSPLTYLSFAIDAKVWFFSSAGYRMEPGSAQDKGLGQVSFGFHLTNLLLHIGAGLVLFALLLELGVGQWGSFFIPLFFLIHPIQTEAVTYINSRGDSLYALFLFAGLWLFARLLSLRGGRQGLPTRQSYMRLLHFARNDVLVGGAIILLFILALLSKEIALAGVALYISIFVLHWLSNRTSGRNTATENYELRIKNQAKYQIHIRFTQCKQNTKYALWVIGAIGITVIVYLLLRLTILNFSGTLSFYGAQNDYTRSLAIRLFTVCRVLWIYLGLLVYPYPLHMERSVELIRSFFSPWVLGTLGLFIGLVILGITEIRKRNTTLILFGLVWFLGMLIPSSGIIPINGILYEHWLYVPMVGFFITLYGIWRLCLSSLRGVHDEAISKQNRLPRFARNDVRKILMSFALVLSILYIFLTIRQNNIWSDPITFYTYTLSFAPSSARLHNNLGMTLADAGRVQEAIGEYKKALALGLGYTQIYNNLGNAYLAMKDYANAERELQIAIQKSPQFFVVHSNLLKVYVVSRQKEKAQEEWNRMEKLFPGVLQGVTFDEVYQQK